MTSGRSEATASSVTKLQTAKLRADGEIRRVSERQHIQLTDDGNVKQEESQHLHTLGNALMSHDQILTGAQADRSPSSSTTSACGDARGLGQRPNYGKLPMQTLPECDSGVLAILLSMQIDVLEMNQ